ncbi:antitoxin HicB [Polaribacter sp. WD7]|uniref:antitoxin HicB n=1 Tax=Polaribacter sp. WD7 TaxID=2269061 RepID=UPI000DF1F0A1|nr:antitoxin HicB [Polaribacter sp. WD7]RCS26158.1 antitoxin HicB [Polaribacter sp. WD7]
MNNNLEYRGFNGSIEYSKSDNIFFGKVKNTDDLISYESTNKESLEKEFQIAVDSYIETVNWKGNY